MANSVRHPQMVRVICDTQPTGDIRTRQPKSPGQRAVFNFTVNPMLNPKLSGPLDYVIPTRLIPDSPVEVWANQTNIGHRCTKCGSTLHARARS